MERRVHIVAFTGRKGHGKDTAARYLKKEIFLVGRNHFDYVTFAFADILKSIAADSLGLGSHDMETIKRNSRIKIANQFSLREYFNTLGDAIKDKLGYDIWAKLTIEDIDRTIKAIEPHYIIITDLRYPVEEAHLKKYCEDNGFELDIIRMINLHADDEVLEIFGKEHESEYLVEEINPTLTIKAKSEKEIEIKIKEFFNELSK